MKERKRIPVTPPRRRIPVSPTRHMTPVVTPDDALEKAPLTVMGQPRKRIPVTPPDYLL